MALTKCKLGEHIELVERPNTNLEFGLDDVRGVNNLKLMIRTKADMSTRKLDKFQIVLPGEFFFNHRTSRNGDKFSVTYNYDNMPHIVTEDYVVFAVKDNGALDPIWLYMYLCRPEFDRYVIQNSWGSSTEFFNWEDLCDVELMLPPLEIQQQFASAYIALVENQTSYDRALTDLKTACDAALDRCKYSDRRETLGSMIAVVDCRNEASTCKSAHGIRVGQGFIPSVASSQDLSNYKLVKPGQIACNLLHVGRDGVFPIAVNHSDEEIAVSPAYCVFEANDIPADYIAAWFSRDETGRLGWFISDDNIRSGMTTSRFFDMKLPVPEKSHLDAVLELEAVLRTRKLLNGVLKRQINGACPILIKGSIEAARR